METKLILLACSLLFINNICQGQVTANDGDWKLNSVVLKNTPQADLMIRLGDIDNLGFGWEENFDPFCGRSTSSHAYPWEINSTDIKGMDRILQPSSFSDYNAPCGGDGYSGVFDNKVTMPVPFDIDLKPAKGLNITSALIQIFVDDFQAPSFCSRFQVKINSVRFKELENLLNIIDQTGPVGKVVTIDIPGNMLTEFKKDKISILIDDPVSGAADGFAIDFIKILFNYKPYSYLGSITGKVVNENDEPISNAFIETTNKTSSKTNNEGVFELKNIYSGLNVLKVTASGYLTEYANVNIICSELVEDAYIRMRKIKQFTFNGQTFIQGDAININNIQFKQGSSEISAESKAELDKIFDFLNNNPEIIIELSGHTSSEGEPGFNIKLSADRVKLCKEYLVNKGITNDRIVAIGYGAENPLAPNDTEANRIKNRRVEMKILKY
ncbi:MAG: OmpA family protein [Bacteroidales bacterium]